MTGFWTWVFLHTSSRNYGRSPSDPPEPEIFRQSTHIHIPLYTRRRGDRDEGRGWVGPLQRPPLPSLRTTVAREGQTLLGPRGKIRPPSDTKVGGKGPYSVLSAPTLVPTGPFQPIDWIISRETGVKEEVRAQTITPLRPESQSSGSHFGAWTEGDRLPGTRLVTW